MFPETWWRSNSQKHQGRAICSFLIAVFAFTSILFLSGCALFEERAGPKPALGPQERVYYFPIEDVWRATLMALQSPNNYPLRVNNMDTGLIETDRLKGSEAWQAPHITVPYASGYSSRLIIRVIKGSLGRRPAIKVNIRKDAKVQRDFFSEPETVISDGLEEKVILYRIDREIQVERALRRANLKKKK